MAWPCLKKGRGSDWSDAEKAWMSGIVPEHTVLEGKQQPHFVVRTYPRGVLLWPLKTSPHSGHLTFDREIGALTWGFLFCLDNVMVRNLKVLAPVQAARSDQCGLQLQASPPKTILHLSLSLRLLSSARFARLRRPTNHWDPEACRALAEFVGGSFAHLICWPMVPNPVSAGGIVAVTHDPLLTYRLIHCSSPAIRSPMPAAEIPMLLQERLLQPRQLERQRTLPLP